jgi:CRP-like cAMP-binding protein
MQFPSCYLFQNLSVPQIDSLAAITFEEQFQKGKWLFYKDQKANKIYLVKKGALSC